MKKIITVLLALSLIVCLCACTPINSKTVMEYKAGNEILNSADQNLLSLVMAVVNFQLGADSLTPEMWDMEYQQDNDTTVKQIVVAQSKAYLEGLLQAEYLCDYAYGIGLSDEQNDSVEKYIESLTSSMGSEKELDKFLSTYGANAKTLERYMKLVMKQDTVYKSFYSEGGIRYNEVEARKEPYFEENFHVADHILIKYAGALKDDGTEIPLTDEEIEHKRSMAKNLYNEITNGVRSFDDALDEFNQDTYKLGYPFGYFVPETFYWSGISTDVQDAVLEMNDGEIKLVDTDEGAYIIRKNAMDSKLYASNGGFETYLESTLAQEDFLALCEAADGVVVYDDVISELDPALIPSFDIDSLMG